MSDYKTPTNGPFTGDPHNPHVAAFLESMTRMHQHNTGLQVIHLFVKAGAPPWLAEQLLANLTKAINHTPAKAVNGAKLRVIEGDKS